MTAQHGLEINHGGCELPAYWLELMLSLLFFFLSFFLHKLLSEGSYVLEPRQYDNFSGHFPAFLVKESLGILNKTGMKPLACGGRNWAGTFQEILIYRSMLKTRKLCEMVN